MTLTQKAVRKLFRDVARAALDVEKALDEGSGTVDALARLNAAIRAIAFTTFVPGRLPAIKDTHG
jgi:hypothetical protein